MGKILFKQSNDLISVILTLLRRKQRLRGGLLTLNTVVQTQMNAQVAQIRQFSRKTQKKLHNLVLIDRKLKLYEIAEELKISEGSVITILHEYLSMRSCVLSGCIVCSQSIKNNNASMILSVVCNCFNATEKSFRVNM